MADIYTNDDRLEWEREQETAPKYHGIDLAPYAGYLVICRSLRCEQLARQRSSRLPTVLGVITPARMGLFPFELTYGAQVFPPRPRTQPWLLPPAHKPKAYLRSEMRVYGPDSWVGGVTGEGASTTTAIPITARVQCPECSRVTSLAHLKRDDLRANS